MALVCDTASLVSRSKNVIVGGVNSPIRTFSSVGVDPIIVARGNGATIWDVAGRQYTDYCMSWGALLFGHAYPPIIERVQSRIAAGTTFGITSEEEIIIAEKMVEYLPFIERVRFVSSGTEATMTAVRIARGYTGREYILKFDGNYHGHADLFLVKAGSGATSFDTDSFSKGVPKAVIEKTLSVPYNDSKAVEQLFQKYAGQIAAVIVEPIAGNMGLIPATKEFLQTVRDCCTRDGTLLIFDEVISGFRAGLHGAAGHYQITPDLATYGKVIAGGFPAAAVGGKREIMEVLAPLGSVYQAGTLSGNPVAMAAGCVVMEQVADGIIYEQLEALGHEFETKVNQVLRTGVLQRVGSVFTLFFMDTVPHSQQDVQQVDGDRFAAYFSHMLQAGIYVPQSPFECGFLSTQHTSEDIDRFVDVLATFETVS